MKIAMFYCQVSAVIVCFQMGVSGTHCVNSVNTPPNAVPNTAPTGAPAENVANARDRARDGGNECARMPSYIKIRSKEAVTVAGDRL